MENKLQRSSVSEAGQSIGSLYTLVPAHGGSRAGAVAAQLSRTLAEGLGAAVLLADFSNSLWQLERRVSGACIEQQHGDERDSVDLLNAPDASPRELGRLLEEARERYNVICADLTNAAPDQSSEVLQSSDAIFLLVATDAASLEGLQEKIEWLRSMNVEERCALLLKREPGGLSAEEMEEISGLPVCSVIDTEEQIAQLARWLGDNVSQPVEELALAC